MVNLNGVIKLFLSSYLIFLQVSAALATSDGRIVGGEATNIEKWPFLLQLKDNDNLLCGATLVTKYHAVTAAHCLINKPKHLHVVGGATKITDGGTARSKIVRHIVHPSFTKKGYDMDVAVLRLEKPLIGANIARISYNCTQDWKVGQKVTLLGWGLLDDETEEVPTDLQTVDVRVIDKKLCARKYRFQRKLSESMECAAAEHKDACSGDSGGPGLMGGQFCAVVSYGIGCADSDFPGVYTKISAVREFINKSIKKLG